jgi:hypothetical protein
MLYDLSRKLRPEIVAAVRRSYDLCRSLNAPVPSICVLLYEQNKCNKFWPYQIRTVRILFAADLPRNPCPALPWNSCHFFAALSSSEKMETSPSLALSQSLLERMTSHLVFFLL